MSVSELDDLRMAHASAIENLPGESYSFRPVEQ